MIPLLKALFMGGILTWILSELIAATRSTGGQLNITEIALSGHYMHWSWPLFIAATGMIWGILLMMQ